MLGWGWNGAEFRGVERLWRYVRPGDIDPFGTPSSDHRGAGDRLAEVLSALVAARINYRFELPFLPSAGGQYLRDPAMVWRAREATCVDMTVLVAAACLRAGIHPWVAIGVNSQDHPEPGGHAWIVVDLGDGAGGPGRFGRPADLTVASENIDAWEDEQSRFKSAPIESVPRLARLVERAPHRYQVIDVARLCVDYPGGPPDTAVLSDRSAMMTGWDHTRACDVGWWWSDPLTHPLPGTAVFPLLDALWTRRPDSTSSRGQVGASVAIGELFSTRAPLVPFVRTEGSAQLAGQINGWYHRFAASRATAQGLGQLALAVLLGSGGAGKTRTALECVDELFGLNGSVDPFALVGMLPNDPTSQRIAALAGQPGTVAIVIDYAESIPKETVEELARQLATRPVGWGQVLIVATGRERGEWLERLTDRLGQPISEIELGPVRTTSGSPLELYDHAVTALAKYLQIDHPESGVSLELLAESSALEILLRAALTVLGELPERASTADTYQAAMKHERAHWQNVVDHPKPGTWTEKLRRDINTMVTIVSLLRPSRADLDVLLQKFEVDAVVGEVIDRLYGDPATAGAFTNAGRQLVGLTPDPLADLVIKEASASQAVWQMMIDAADAIGAWPNMLAVLDRAEGPNPKPATINRLADHLSKHSELLDIAFPIAAQTKGIIRAALETLAHDAAPPERLVELAEASSQRGIGTIRVAIAELRVAVAQELAVKGTSHLPYLADALDSLGIRYSDLGQKRDAIDPAQEAVNIYRTLASTEPAHLPDLAKALNNLGYHYSDLGQKRDAIDPTQEAVNIYRTLASTEPAHLPDLARALNGLGNHYSDLATPSGEWLAWSDALACLTGEAQMWLVARRAHRLAAAGQVASTVDDLCAIAVHRPGLNSRLDLLGDARRHASQLVGQAIASELVDGRYTTSTTAITPLLDSWLSAMETSAEPTALRELISTFTSNEIHSHLGHWHFLHPENQAGERVIEVLDAIEHDGIDAVTGHMESTAARATWTLELADAIDAVDIAALRTAVTSPWASDPLAIDMLDSLPEDRGTRAAALIRCNQGGSLPVAIEVLKSPDSCRHQILSILYSDRHALAADLATVQPSAVTNKERSLLAQAASTLEKPVELPSSTNDSPSISPPSSMIGEDLRRALEDSAKRFPELRPLLTNPQQS